MSALVETYDKKHHDLSIYSALLHKISMASLAETFWFSTALILSCALGPFAAIPALIAVFSLAHGENGRIEPESF